MSMGFTTALYSTGDAFIYNQPYGYYQDSWTMIHEFGHYNAAYHAAERCLYEPATLDVARSIPRDWRFCSSTTWTICSAKTGKFWR